MAKTSGGNPMMMGAPGEMISVSINGNHKTIDKILKAKTKKQKKKLRLNYTILHYFLRIC